MQRLMFSGCRKAALLPLFLTIVLTLVGCERLLGSGASERAVQSKGSELGSGDEDLSDVERPDSDGDQYAGGLTGKPDECGIGRRLEGGRCVIDGFLGIDIWGWSGNAQSFDRLFAQMEADGLSIHILGIEVSWDDLEPRQPDSDDGRQFDFDNLDQMVVVAQNRGLVLDLGLNCRSDWATEKALGEIGEIDEPCCDMSPPRQDETCPTTDSGLSCSQAWRDLVYAIVERYDADDETGCRLDISPPDCYREGDNMYPALDLQTPAIAYLQFGNEPEAVDHFWVGLSDNGILVSAETAAGRYDEVLGPAFEGAKAANPQIVVLRGRSNPGNVFDDLLNEADLERMESIVNDRRPGFLPFVRSSIEISRDHYDAFAFNFNDQYTGLMGYSRWVNSVQNELALDRPLLVEDARMTLFPRDNDSPEHILPRIYPSDYVICNNSYCEINPSVDDSLWQADKVRQAIRKIAVALATDQRTISLQPIGNLRANTPLWVASGLFDFNLALEGEIANAREPVYYALQQIMTVINGADAAVETLDVGENIFALRITSRGTIYWLIWHEDFAKLDDVGLLKRNQSIVIDLSPFAAADQIRIFHFVTRLDESRRPIFPASEVVRSAEVPVDETPILLEELKP